MESTSRLFADQEGRLVRMIGMAGTRRPYYSHAGTTGFIETDSRGEFIEMEGRKRYWRGIIRDYPDHLLALEDFCVCILKPDAKRSELREEVLELLQKDLAILYQKEIWLDKQDVFRLYPYFFEEEWENELLGYMTSDSSLLMIVKGDDVYRKLSALKTRIRQKYAAPDGHPVRNLVHCSDDKDEAVREALVFFGAGELCDLINS